MHGRRRAGAVQVAMLAVSIAWVGSVGFATLVRAASRDAWPESCRVAAGLVYVTGSFICHQRPERSFHVDGAPLPVCARCTGIYVGVVIGLLLASGPSARRALGERRGGGDRVWLIAAALPTAVSVGVEWLGGPSPLWIRAAAALPLGAVVALLLARLDPLLDYSD